MKPRNGDPEDRIKQADQPAGEKRTGTRATRHNLRLPFRYRLEGRQEWRTGETINISKSGVLFFSSEILELETKVEIIFQISGIALQHASTHRAMVVRRMLNNWPETRLIFGARFDG